MTTTLTVGAALALPEVQSGEAVVEFFATVQFGQWSLVTDRGRRVPWWFSLRWYYEGRWTAGAITEVKPIDLAGVCRVIPAAEADKDPSAREPIEGDTP